MNQLFLSGGQNIGASTSAPVRIVRIDFLQDGLVGSPCSPRDPQESSPTPQFKGINSSMLHFILALNNISLFGWATVYSFTL